MDQLGLEPAPDHAAWRMAVAGSTRSDEELLEHLHECAAEIGHTPRIHEYADWQRERLRNGTHGVRYLGTQSYRKRFGDWPQAVRAAGLPYNGGTEPRTRASDWAAGQPLQLLREAAQEAGGGRLRRSQYVAWRERRLAQQRAAGDYTAVAAAEAIAYHYGGWLAALAAAGLISDDAASNLRLGAGRAFTAEEINDCIARFALETAESPSSRQYRSWRQAVMTREANLHLPAHTVLARRLDGWANVRTQVMLARRTARREASVTEGPSQGADIVARLVPALSLSTCRQLRALLADHIATHDVLGPAHHSLVGVAALIDTLGRRVRARTHRATRLAHITPASAARAEAGCEPSAPP